MNNNSNSTNQNQKNINNNVSNKKINSNDKRFWIAIAVFIVLVALVMWDNDHRANAPTVPTAVATDIASTSASDMTVASATSTQVYNYSCDNNKDITVTFHMPKDDFVNVNFSDGRHLILAHTISADGARYANANESIVFWTKGVTAFVEENGTTTYAGCVANRFP